MKLEDVGRKLQLGTLSVPRMLRNKCIYNHTCLSPDRSIRDIQHYIEKYKVATTIEDEQLLEAEHNPVVAETIWTLPLNGVVKINVDASIPHQAGMVSLCVVLQDSNDRVLGAGKKPMSFQGGVTHAEILAICFGVQLGKEFGCSSIIVESDNLNVVQVVASSDECYLTYGALIEDLKEPLPDSALLLFCSSSPFFPLRPPGRKKKENPAMPWKIGKEVWYFPLPFLF
ncbi:hypothetical protein SLEP1_g24627 [Rubroshorea leprosula]|uniref:RNase H type-1 domain-containing protein n=1 Tax=Rubroshorea leprosula TaxID=152421 RepID=A0AAV5JGH8_9ROSI|nr:hypothetical protein SLEP1_g24627 [Rubroshorea leprosula]